MKLEILQRNGKMDWFKIGKICQGCILSPCILTSMQSTVVLERTLESLVDCKEIKPVKSKGNQS